MKNLSFLIISIIVVNPIYSQNSSFCNKLLDTGIFNTTNFSSSIGMQKYLLDEYHAQFSYFEEHDEGFDFNLDGDSFGNISNIGFSEGSTGVSDFTNAVSRKTIFQEKHWNDVYFSQRTVANNLVSVLERCADNDYEGKIVAYTELDTNNPYDFNLTLIYDKTFEGPDEVSLKIRFPDGKSQIKDLSRVDSTITLKDNRKTVVALSRKNLKKLRIEIVSEWPVVDPVISVLGLKEEMVWLGVFEFENEKGDKKIIDMKNEDLDTWNESWAGRSDGTRRTYIDNRTGAQYGWATRRGLFGVVSQIGPVSKGERGPIGIAGNWYRATDGGGHWIQGRKKLESVMVYY